MDSIVTLLLVDLVLLAICWIVCYLVYPFNFTGSRHSLEGDAHSAPSLALKEEMALARDTPAHTKRVAPRAVSWGPSTGSELASQNAHNKQARFDGSAPPTAFNDWRFSNANAHRDADHVYLEVTGVDDSVESPHGAASGQASPPWGDVRRGQPATRTLAIQRSIARLEAHLPIDVESRVDRLLGLSGGVYVFSIFTTVVLMHSHAMVLIFLEVLIVVLEVGELLKEAIIGVDEGEISCCAVEVCC